MNGLRHAVIVRLHYQPGDPKFAWRLAFFRPWCCPGCFPERLLRHDAGF